MAGGFEDYKFKDKPIKLWKVMRPASLNLYRSIVSNPFKFVEFQIKTSALTKVRKEEALLLWSQAEEFYKSADDISIYAKPLPTYYCILNTVKTLLVFKGVSFKPFHGVSGKRVGSKSVLLNNESLEIHSNNIAGTFYNYLDSTHNSKVAYNLKELFYNLPFTHRAYLQTFNAQSDLFLPVEAPRFSIVENEIRLTARCLEENLTFHQKLSNFVARNPDFSLIKDSVGNYYLASNPICVKTLSDNQIHQYILKDYLKLRSSFVFIEGEKTLWYFRKSTTSKPARNRLPLPVTILAISHKMSELSRYEPLKFKAHLESDYGWMLHEFVEGALDQFLAYISCEICGKELAKPRLR
jgi:hypothetical protein